MKTVQTPQGLQIPIVFSALNLIRRSGLAQDALIVQKLLREGRILISSGLGETTRGLTAPQEEGKNRKIYLDSRLFDPKAPFLSALRTAATLVHELAHWKNARDWSRLQPLEVAETPARKAENDFFHKLSNRSPRI